LSGQWQTSKKRRSKQTLLVALALPSGTDAFSPPWGFSLILAESGLEKVGSEAHIRGMSGFTEWLTGTHICDCGATYKITWNKTTFPHTGNATCEKCGGVMDSWRNSTSVRSYKLMLDDE
jgi:hypothetical protein